MGFAVGVKCALTLLFDWLDCSTGGSNKARGPTGGEVSSLASSAVNSLAQGGATTQAPPSHGDPSRTLSESMCECSSGKVEKCKDGCDNVVNSSRGVEMVLNHFCVWLILVSYDQVVCPPMLSVALALIWCPVYGPTTQQFITEIIIQFNECLTQWIIF